MHVVSVGCTSIFFFSVESRQASITGLVDALSDHFTSFFSVTREQSLLCSMKEVRSQPSLSITAPAVRPPACMRSITWNTRPCLPIRPTSKWMFNEHFFRSHNGMSLMSCNDLPADGHASMLFPPLRLWQLTMVWTLLLVDNASLLHDCNCSTRYFFFWLLGRELWLFPWEKRYQVGWWFYLLLLLFFSPLLLFFVFNVYFDC